jgi:hypothetical protein
MALIELSMKGRLHRLGDVCQHSGFGGLWDPAMVSVSSRIKKAIAHRGYDWGAEIGMPL